jgi:hypothetical protein
MKNRKKVLLLAVAGVLILALMIGGILARESVQSCSVYSYTHSNTNSFQANSPGSGWSWRIAVYNTQEGGFLGVHKDSPSNPYILYEVRYQSDGGNIDIDDGHYYYLNTWWGNENEPGSATCTVASVSWNPDKHGGN